MTKEEKELLKKLATGVFDRFVGNDLTTSNGSAVWKAIKNGIPTIFKQEPSKRFFNGEEYERIEGVLHILEEWSSDERKLEFLQKFGWLMNDKAVREYSAKLKSKK